MGRFTYPDGGEVKLPGFGSFVIAEKAARQGKNPLGFCSGRMDRILFGRLKAVEKLLNGKKT